LYYPWIHFRDEAWLKVALLYWRHLERIVPSNYERRDSETIRLFAANRLIRSVPNTKKSRVRVARLFEEVITSRTADLQRYRIDPVRLAESSQQVEGLPRVDDRARAEYAYVHVEKMEDSLRETLCAADLAQPNRDGDWSWIGVHPTIARIYMTALAADIASASGLQPVTDDSMADVAGDPLVDHIAVSGWSVEQLSEALFDELGSEPTHTTGEAAATLAFVALKTVTPADPDALSAAQVLAIREKYSDELDAFHAAIQHTASSSALAEVTDHQAFQERLTELYADDVAPMVSKLESDLRLFGVETVSSWANIRTTFAGSTLGAGMAVWDPAVGTAGAVGLGFLTLTASAHAETKRQIEGNPAAYLLRVREHLTPATLRQRFKYAARRFLKGF
jgi:uncharacterized protein DUF6236